jgi:hypothetical protein
MKENTSSTKRLTGIFRSVTAVPVFFLNGLVISEIANLTIEFSREEPASGDESTGATGYAL